MDGKALLNEEIQKKIEAMGELKVDSEEYRRAADGVSKLMEKAIELDKLDMEAYDREKTREDEKEFKEKQLKEDKKDRLVKNILTGLGIVLPAGLTVWGTLKSLKFEETGTVTTLMGRGFLNKLLPKK